MDKDFMELEEWQLNVDQKIRYYGIKEIIAAI
jgi:hypothetical protein